MTSKEFCVAVRLRVIADDDVCNEDIAQAVATIIGQHVLIEEIAVEGEKVYASYL